MSENLEELKQHQAELKQFLQKARERRQRWQGDLAQRQAELKEAILADEGVYKRNNRVQAAKAAVATWSEKIAETEQELEAIEGEMAELEYKKRKAEVAQARRDAYQAIEQAESDLLGSMRECYSKALQAQREYNRQARGLGSLAKQVGQRPPTEIGRMNGLGVVDYVDGIIRAAVHEGRL